MTEATVTPVTIKHAAARLHAAKARIATIEAWWNEKIEALREMHSDTLHELHETKIDAMEAEADLRAAALAEYEVSGKKTLGHGVGIRVTTKLDYDAADALAWAKEHDMALSLDKFAFECIAKASPIEFVQLVETPTVTLPRDAAKLLGEG